MEPLRRQEMPLAVFDLSEVDYFGSMFLALLIRCWKLVSARGGMMALAGVSDRARELLRVTSLDMVWPIYANRREATFSPKRQPHPSFISAILHISAASRIPMNERTNERTNQRMEMQEPVG